MSDITSMLANPADGGIAIVNQLLGVDNYKNFLSIPFNDHLALSVLFKTFNTTLLSFAFVLYAFILVVGTINSARDGKILGKDYDVYWLPLRVVLGTLAVIPAKSGYCIAQWVIYLALSVSANMANTVWDKLYSSASKGEVSAVMPDEIKGYLRDKLSIYYMHNMVAQAVSSEFSQPEVNQAADKTDTPKSITLPVDLANGAVDPKRFSQYDTELKDSIKHALEKTTDTKEDVFEPSMISNLSGYFNALLGQSDASYWDTNSINGLNSTINYFQFGFDHTALLGNYRFTMSNSTQNQSTRDCGVCLLGDVECFRCGELNDLQKEIQQEISEYVKQSDWKALDTTVMNIINKVMKLPNSSSLLGHSSWWDADRNYLTLDDGLDMGLKRLYGVLSEFDQAYHVSDDGTLTLNSEKLGLYIINKNNKQKVYRADVPVPMEVNKTTGQAFSENISMLNIVNLRELRVKYIELLGDDQRDAINQLITDNLRPVYRGYLNLSYLYIMAQQKKGESNQKVNVVQFARQMIDFLSDAKANGVELYVSNDKGQSNAASVDPAQTFLDKIFAKVLGDDYTATTQASRSLLDRIYHFAMDDHSEQSKDENYVQHGFSMIKRVQALGIGLMQDTVDIAESVFKHASNGYLEITEGYKRSVDDVMKNSTGDAVLAAFFPFVSGYLQAEKTLEFAKVSSEAAIKTAELSLTLMWLPLVFYVLTTVFGIGVVFALLVPLTPFILFWAGKMVWLLLVIEAMVAAPIMALGIVYPEGHKVFGKAQSGIQMMVGLLFRPVLMIIGLIAGITLTYVVIHFSAEGFHAIASQLVNFIPDEKSYAKGAFVLLLTFLYASFIGIAFHKCFSMIYLVPDKVLQWIGHQAGDRAGEQVFQEIKGATTQQTQQLGQAGSQTVNQGIETQKQNQAQLQQTYGAEKKAEYEKDQALAKSISSGVADVAKTAAKVMV